MTSYEMLHLQDAQELIGKLLKYPDTYNKADFKDKLKVCIYHLSQALYS